MQKHEETQNAMRLILEGERTDGPMTEERLAELEKMVQEATEGPWEVRGRGGLHMDGTSDMYIAEVRKRNRVMRLVSVYGCGDRGETAANARLIGEVRTAFPELLTEVRRLRACLETLAHMTSFSGDHPNSHVWAYIMGEALQADPQESPFWQEDEVSHD